MATLISVLMAKFDVLNASNSVKYQMIRKAADLLDAGKTVEEAFQFVSALKNDGQYEGEEGAYTKSQMVSFGNFLLGTRKKLVDEVVKQNPSLEAMFSVVHHADLANWKNPVYVEDATKPAAAEGAAQGIDGNLADASNSGIPDVRPATGSQAAPAAQADSADDKKGPIS